jgi:hypothetical protein
MSTDIVAIILAVGSLLPLLTSLAQQPNWSTKTRVAVGVGLSALAGLVAYVTQYGFNVNDWSDVVTFIVGVVLAAAAAYKTIWQPATIAGKIELATSKFRNRGAVTDNGKIVVDGTEQVELVDPSHPVV